MAKVIDALVRVAERAPDRIAFVDDVASISYASLARRVAGAFSVLSTTTSPIGLMAENSLDWVIADLGVTATGRRFVPLPTFFSDEQLSHIIQDSGVDLILCDEVNETRAKKFAQTARVPQMEASADLLSHAGAGQRVIYTSGSTGRPKGVQLGDHQIDFISMALVEAISATETDSYLSVLPFPLLLEELCGIHVPIIVGGTSTIRKTVAADCAGGDIDAIRRAFEDVRPSVTVLVPELLRAWVGALILGSHRAPDSLRVVAVGGAPVPPQVLEAAVDAGVPCVEGYGLSECGSVVALNRPGTAKPGTVGKPLKGLTVDIVDGEIIVEGPSVMAGYLGQSGHQGRWHTGDLGHFDDEGALIVEGRKDALLVTSYGRNVQPEWIEARLQGDPRILRAVVTGHGQAYPTVLLAPGAFAGNFFEEAGAEDVIELIQTICAQTPEYARPDTVIVTNNEEMQSKGFLTPNGRIRRDAVQKWLVTEEAKSRIVEKSRNEEHFV